jgi:hypothetical protein
MREKREANANATWRALIRDRPRGDGVKGTETDVLYGVEIRPRGDGVIKGLKLTLVLCAGVPEFCRSSGGFLPAGAGAAVLSSQLRPENQNDLYYVCDLIAGKYVIQ